VFQITIFFLYLAAAILFALSRLPSQANRSPALVTAGFLAAASAVLTDGWLLYTALDDGHNVTLSNTVAIIGFQLGAIGLLGTAKPVLRGLSAGLLLLAGVLSLLAGKDPATVAATTLSWQVRTHVLTSLFAYGLLTVGAIVAIAGLVQEWRLKARRLSPANQLFAPLETTEWLLYAVTAAGFTVLLLSVISGLTFIEDLFAQHLVHKTTLSLLALAIFGILLAGRQFAGWRGRRAIYLYLAGFALLGVGYFGSRVVLEEILGRSWS